MFRTKVRLDVPTGSFWTCLVFLSLAVNPEYISASYGCKGSHANTYLLMLLVISRSKILSTTNCYDTIE